MRIAYFYGFSANLVAHSVKLSGLIVGLVSDLNSDHNSAS